MFPTAQVSPHQSPRSGSLLARCDRQPILAVPDSQTAGRARSRVKQHVPGIRALGKRRELRTAHAPIHRGDANACRAAACGPSAQHEQSVVRQARWEEHRSRAAGDDLGKHRAILRLAVPGVDFDCGLDVPERIRQERGSERARSAPPPRPGAGLRQRAESPRGYRYFALTLPHVDGMVATEGGVPALTQTPAVAYQPSPVSVMAVPS